MQLITALGVGSIGLSVCLAFSCGGGKVYETAGASAQATADNQSPARRPALVSEEAFLESFVAAMNSKDMGRRRQLVHPASLACITAENQDYYEHYFSKEFGRTNLPHDCGKAPIRKLAADEPLRMGGGSGGCRVSMQPIAADAALLLEADFSYPARPTHWLQVEYGDRGKMVQVTREGGSWREVIPCPKLETVKKFRERRTRQE